MIGLRQKLILGFGGLLVITAAVGALTMIKIGHLGRAIDIILRENYRSVIACQDMKESLERIDSGMLFSFAGSPTEGQRYIEENIRKFRAAIKIELANLTVPGEAEKAVLINPRFVEYLKAVPRVIDLSLPLEKRRETYFSGAFPLFLEMKGLAQEILEMNQANMNKANNTARLKAAAAHRQMLLAIFASAVLAFLFSFLVQRWILKPIRTFIESANEIRKGNLEIVLNTDTRDEIGLLSEAFNAMTEALRRVRRSEQLDLMRTRKATEEVFKALPAVIAVLDPDGRVEVSTETAEKYFGLKPGALVKDLGFPWMSQLLQNALDKDRIVGNEPGGSFIQQFVENREYFFQPAAFPILAEPNRDEPTGTVIILKDVTQVHEQQELKRNVVSTVSHQLRTPLTSLRMSIHLLFEEKVGPLNEKQAELVSAARDESERLVEILDGLLDLNRIESGRSLLELRPVSPHVLVREAVEPFLVDSQDKGISLINTAADDLPMVLADSARIRHVFANLLSNALRFTSPGGSITINAYAEPGVVRFEVSDTGKGIAAEHLDHLFEQFYRVPGQGEETGVGLGLAIVKQIILAHGGKVSVDSQPGKGSNFRFTLPYFVSDGQGLF